ncbi:hypothetical protein IIB50_02270 [Patescibacteria group bacterium]|nr:hypothetical protein [Patescibacteria group bacterium]
MKYLSTIIDATKITMQESVYRILFIPITILSAVLFVAIPVIFVPSNTLKLQFGLYTFSDYVVLTLLALLSSLFIIMKYFTYKQSKRESINLASVGRGGLGGTSVTAASIFGAASCPMCVASLFGFLGFGAVGLLVTYQWWIFAITLILFLVIIYYSSRQIIGKCEKCNIHE